VANDFEAVGFSIGSQEQFAAICKEQAAKWPRTPTPVGGWYVPVGAGGPELWVQMSPDGEIVGAHPHFSGPSRFRIRFQSLVKSESDTPLDGTLSCTMVDDQEGVPMVLDVPDFRLHAAWLAPQTLCTVQIAAFQRGFSIFDTDEAFKASKMGMLSPDGAFIPSGMFIPQGQKVAQPRNEAFFAGRLQSAAVHPNSVTGAEVLVLTVKTLGGTVEIPVPRSERPVLPAPNSIVCGGFALSARLIEPHPAPPPLAGAQKPSLLRRILGRKG
jgi:hypothetical protein